VKTNQEARVQRQATRIGRLILRLTIKPEIRGGRAMPSDWIDWLMPKISPWELLSAKEEIRVVELG